MPKTMLQIQNEARNTGWFPGATVYGMPEPGTIMPDGSIQYSKPKTAEEAFREQGTPLGPVDASLPSGPAPAGQEWFKDAGSSQWGLRPTSSNQELPFPTTGITDKLSSGPIVTGGWATATEWERAGYQTEQEWNAAGRQPNYDPMFQGATPGLYNPGSYADTGSLGTSLGSNQPGVSIPANQNKSSANYALPGSGSLLQNPFTSSYSQYQAPFQDYLSNLMSMYNPFMSQGSGILG